MAWPKGQPRDPASVRKAVESRGNAANRKSARKAKAETTRFSIDDLGSLKLEQAKYLWELTPEDTQRLRSFLVQTAPLVSAQQAAAIAAVIQNGVTEATPLQRNS
jgi:hypothetical protein